jgi:hypothetical protein
MLYRFPMRLKLSETLFTYRIHTVPADYPLCYTATLHVNSRANENSGITAQLKIASETTNLITQILTFLAYGRSLDSAWCWVFM